MQNKNIQTEEYGRVQKGIFDKRVEYKPFEYPEVYKFIEAINKTFWVHSEVDFTADVQDFHSYLNDKEKSAIKNSLLSISQIEVAVKSFWGDLYKNLPKPELNGLGSTFAETEFRHSEAYSRLLEVLGYNEEFKKLIEIPVIRKRINYLNNSLSRENMNSREEYTLSLIMFSILIENVSLFSQFAIILSFTRFKGLMKNVSNIIAWTSLDEQVHANAGMFLVNVIRDEYPYMFTDEMEDKVYRLVEKSIEVEAEILEWIFSNGEIESIGKKDLLNFMKYRSDDSLDQIGYKKIFNVTESEISPMRWFEEDVFANSLDDFFAKRPVDYTKHDKSISVSDLF